MALIENMDKILRFDEGVKLQLYRDNRHYWTIGIGTLIDKTMNPETNYDEACRMLDALFGGVPHHGEISIDEANVFLNTRLEQKEKRLNEVLPWWRQETEIRQCAMLSMAYQMGTTRLREFHNTLKYWQEGAYVQAAREALDSDWYRIETPKRALRVTHMIEFDEFPPEYGITA